MNADFRFDAGRDNAAELVVAQFVRLFGLCQVGQQRCLEDRA